jgi:hypothetical protein
LGFRECKNFGPHTHGCRRSWWRRLSLHGKDGAQFRGFTD